MDRQRGDCCPAATGLTLTEVRTGRAAQRARTRKEILRAASRLLERGVRPNLDEVAAEAEVSRATAYRYFPGLDALLDEAAVDSLVPEPEALFAADASLDPLERLLLADEVIDRASRERETALRLMLSRILERSTLPGEADAPLRQNRRMPMIEAALAPMAGNLDATTHELLARSLAMVIGAESLIALKDVVGLDEQQAREVRQWAIAALVKAALPLDG